MSNAIDFYFDFSSPYGYFAAMRIDELAAKYGGTVKWHPVLLGVIFKSTGGAPLPTLPLKGAYSLHDMERTARFSGIAYRIPQTFPVSTQAAARAMLWVRNTSGDAKAIEFAKSMYQAYFVDNVNIGDANYVVRLASDFGQNPAAMTEAINSTEIKEQLKDEVDRALKRGVFGSPYIIVDDEPFWGFDRFDQLEAFLKNGKI